MPDSLKSGFFLLKSINICMKIKDKIVDLLDEAKFNVENFLFTVKFKIEDIKDYVKYELFKKEEKYDFIEKLVEDKPKKKKKKKKK